MPKRTRRTTCTSEAGARIRALDPGAAAELELVARRMRETLEEVLGGERGGQLYSHEWLVNRVRQHLQSGEITGQVFLAETAAGEIVGHTIVRLDEDEAGGPLGLFSTVFVAPGHRRAGVATALLTRGERWMLDHGRARAVTYTAASNHKLHRLFLTRGYELSPMPGDFVALSKALVE